MNNKDRIYLFFGLASEYVLNPLYKYMTNLGYKCIELDLKQNKDWYKTIKSISNEEIVLITSAHLFFDSINLEHIYYKDRVISVLELIDYLRPVKKIYYPHDLANPILDYELKFMSLFDVILTPLKYLGYLERYSKVVEVGWIKKTKILDKNNISSNEEVDIVFTFSNMSYFMEMGLEEMYQFWKPIFDFRVKVKLPYWQGSEILKNYLIKKDVQMYPSTINIFDLFEKSNLIITNGDTSVNIEASLSGIPTLNIIDDSIPSYNQKKMFACLPQLKVVSIDEGKNYLQKVISGQEKVKFGKDFLEPFNYKKAVKAITL